MEKSFSSLAELQAEIQLLKVKEFQQKELVKEQLSSPSAIFHAVSSLFKSGNTHQPLGKNLLSQDMVTNLARVGIPLIMNGFLFKRSGFIAKMLITFLSQKAAKNVTSNAVSGAIDKVQGLIKNFMGQKKRRAPVRDYGIPPDSESF
ncbi:hypothetical protein [Arcticibacter sp.]|jgi:hypothetical protein|uniref:hypothetical protein n=1 Tax=Arcticibacter sp. TaxID=1872630 RepID=UPI003890216A